jgi:hypothetical protein
MSDNGAFQTIPVYLWRDATVRPPTPKTGEAVDATGKDCSICLENFNNGEKLVVLSCGGSHMLCEECFEMWRATKDDYDVICPECRETSHASTVVTAQTYIKGGTEDDPITL